VGLSQGREGRFDLEIKLGTLSVKVGRTNATALKKLTSKAARHSFRSPSAIRVTGLKVP
jgi:hypothetical protein